mmetsp:Transcript_2353/g.3603  ORF Transcript_2353/g.3603 Transcript_2353/m.3603 type:complete len:154 (-) Transcript_2353:57-518(-)
MDARYPRPKFDARSALGRPTSSAIAGTDPTNKTPLDWTTDHSCVAGCAGPSQAKVPCNAKKCFALLCNAMQSNEKYGKHSGCSPSSLPRLHSAPSLSGCPLFHTLFRSLACSSLWLAASICFCRLPQTSRDSRPNRRSQFTQSLTILKRFERT